MLAIPSVKGMFNKAIIQSGLPNCIMTHKMARENIGLFLEGMGLDWRRFKKIKKYRPFWITKR